MKKLMLSLILGLFLVSFAIAASDTTFSFESDSVSHSVEFITATSNSATFTADGTSKEISEQTSLPYDIDEIGDVKIILTHAAESASLGSLEATALIGVEESFSNTDTTKTITVDGTTYTVEFITGSSTEATISVNDGTTTTSKEISPEQEGGAVSVISGSNKIGDIQFILTHAAESVPLATIEASFLMLIEKEFLIEAATPETNETSDEDENETDTCPNYSSPDCGDGEVVRRNDANGCPKPACKGTENKFGLGQTIRGRVKAGVYTNEAGDQMRVSELAKNRLRLHVGNTSVDCDCDGLNITQEQVQNRTRLKTKLKNGRDITIKIMPNVASLTALKRLRLKVCNESRNCSIELKEVGKGNKTRLVYEAKARKTFKILGFIKNREQVRTRIDAETGEEIDVKRPWWAWMASEEDEADEN
jgi:hypothetical protein